MAKVRFLTFYLLRNFLKEKYTIGNLYCNGIEFDGKKTRMIENQFLCNILEDKFRGNDLSKKKVYGETCIPEGTYEIKLVYSPHFKRKLPELQNVPFFTKSAFSPNILLKISLLMNGQVMKSFWKCKPKFWISSSPIGNAGTN